MERLKFGIAAPAESKIHSTTPSSGLGVCLRKDEVAVGFDGGVVIIKLGRDEPTSGMDSSGK
jgi:hypothetical protein